MVLTTVAVTLDVLALCAAIAMTVQAMRAHRVTRSRPSLAFFTCFTLISLGLLLRTLTDLFVDATGQLIGLVPGVVPLGLTDQLLLLMGSLLILSGFTLLLLVVENQQSVSMWILVFVLIGLTILVAQRLYLVTHVVAILLLGLLAYRFYLNFLRQNSTNSLLVYLAFLSLMAAHVAMTVAIVLVGFIQGPHVLYIPFYALQLVGYFLLFSVSWRVSRG